MDAVELAKGLLEEWRTPSSPDCVVAAMFLRMRKDGLWGEQRSSRLIKSSISDRVLSKLSLMLLRRLIRSFGMVRWGSSRLMLLPRVQLE